jgi:hypothetical protein
MWCVLLLLDCFSRLGGSTIEGTARGAGGQTNQHLVEISFRPGAYQKLSAMGAIERIY